MANFCEINSIFAIRILSSMYKILITGGAGNVGSALVEKLIQNKNNYVVIVDNLSTGYLSKLPSEEFDNWKFIKADVNNYRDISC